MSNITINIDELGTNNGNEVWSDLNVGNAGTPVYIDNGIPKACNIIEGEEGDAGEIGIQGRTGLQGLQGPRGAQGATGSQGLIGTQGPQGRGGMRGYSGEVGVQGPVGLQGSPGLMGPQGNRGCIGVQGNNGILGPQGPRGRSGNPGYQGLLGVQGNEGAQGAQGTRGAIGMRGEMGNQGDTGTVGIQGLVGPDGAVWDDGIRLSGYNTHLFDYDSVSGKYVPRNTRDDGTGTRVAADLLYLKDGSVLKIWLNDEAFESITTTNSIKVDSTWTVNGVVQTIEAEYPVYYTDGVYLSNVINHDNDVDTVIEVTYRNNAWYYTGGLVTPTITDSFEVTGVTLGNISDGMTIAAGTTIQELFEKMFKKEINPKVGKAPSAKISFSSEISTVEVGSSVKNNSIVYTFTDGYFESSDKQNYPDAKFDTVNNCSNGKLASGCVKGSVTYTYNGTTMASDEIDIESVVEMDYNYVASVSYSDSTVVPKSNVGNEHSEIMISAGVAETNSIKISGRYKMYYGCKDKLAQNDYLTNIYFDSQDKIATAMASHNIIDGWMDNSGENTIENIESTVEDPSFVLIVPEGWEVTRTENSMGVQLPLDTTWYKQNDFDYTIGTTVTKYNVFVSPSTEQTSFKNIIISKVINNG